VKNSIIVWLCLCPGIALSQVDSLHQKIKYYNSFVSGVMIGSSEDDDEKNISVSFITIHGVKFNRGVKVGVGAGLDTYYDLKAFPIVCSVTFDQERKKQGLFLQLNTGYSFARYTREPEFEEIEVDAEGGFTINPMVGYRLTVENARIYLQAGYKYQEAQLFYKYPDWWGSTRASKDYELNRFVIQLGFGFE
jgi:opacity protein-like surface antigen